MRFRFVPLEERIVLDAAAAVDAAEVVDDQDSSTETGLEQAELVEATAGPSEVEVLVVASDHPDLSSVLAELSEDILVIYYDSTQSLSEILQSIETGLGSTEASRMGFLNYGDAASFHLNGAHEISFDSLTFNSDLQDFWVGISELLATDARVELLDTDIEASPTGDDVMDLLGSYTSSDVSTNSEAVFTPTPQSEEVAGNGESLGGNDEQIGALLDSSSPGFTVVDPSLNELNHFWDTGEFSNGNRIFIWMNTDSYPAVNPVPNYRIYDSNGDPVTPILSFDRMGSDPGVLASEVAITASGTHAVASFLTDSGIQFQNVDSTGAKVTERTIATTAAQPGGDQLDLRAGGLVTLSNGNVALAFGSTDVTLPSDVEELFFMIIDPVTLADVVPITALPSDAIFLDDDFNAVLIPDNLGGFIAQFTDGPEHSWTRINSTGAPVLRDGVTLGTEVVDYGTSSHLGFVTGPSNGTGLVLSDDSFLVHHTRDSLLFHYDSSGVFIQTFDMLSVFSIKA